MFHIGSINSEHSGSMNSDEFSDFIGHNYAQPPPQLRISLPLEDEVSVRLKKSTSPKSSQEGSNASSHEQIQPLTLPPVAMAPGMNAPISSPTVVVNDSSISLENLQENINVQNGILTLTNNESGETSKNSGGKQTWSAVVQKNFIQP